MLTEVAKGAGDGKHAHDTTIGTHKASQVSDTFLYFKNSKNKYSVSKSAEQRAKRCMVLC